MVDEKENYLLSNQLKIELNRKRNRFVDKINYINLYK